MAAILRAVTVLYRALWSSEPGSITEYLTSNETPSPPGHRTTRTSTPSMTARPKSRSPEYAVLQDTKRRPRAVHLGAQPDRHTAETDGWEGTARHTSDGMTWTTVVRVVTADGLVHAWVENQAESDRLISVHLSTAAKSGRRPARRQPRPPALEKLTQIDPVSVSAAGIPILIDHLHLIRTNPADDRGQPAQHRRRRCLAVACWQDRLPGRRRRRGDDSRPRCRHSLQPRVRAIRPPGTAASVSMRRYPSSTARATGTATPFALEAEDPDHWPVTAGPDRPAACSLSARRRPDPAFEAFSAPTAPVDLSGFLSIEDADTIVGDLQTRLDAAVAEARAAEDDQEGRAN